MDRNRFFMKGYDRESPWSMSGQQSWVSPQTSPIIDSIPIHKVTFNLFRDISGQVQYQFCLDMKDLQSAVNGTRNPLTRGWIIKNIH